MTRFQIGVILLLLLLAVGLMSGSTMARIQQPIAAAMENAAQLALSGNREAAEETAKAAEQAWFRAHTFVAALADHQPLEDIESLFAKLPAYAGENPSEYAALCAELARKIRAVAEAHELSVASFF